MAETREGSGKLPFKVKLAYGLSGYTNYITWTLFSLYGLYFFTDVVGFTSAFAGAIISLGTLWDAVADPFIGSISDSCKSPHGRRRPFIIGIAVPFALTSILLFTNWGFGEAVAKVYYVVVILAYYTCQATLDITSSALGSEMTDDYDERSSLATYKNFFCMSVAIVVSPTLMLVESIGAAAGSTALGWSGTLAIYLVIALVAIFFLWRGTKGYERSFEEGSDNKLSLAATKEILKNKSTLIVIVIFALGVFANTVNLTLQVYYLSYCLELTAAQIGGATLISGISGVVAAFGVDVLCARLSKRAAWVISIGLMGSSVLVLIGFVIQPGQALLFYFTLCLMALGTAAVYQVPWSMIPDCVDAVELSSGKRLDGVVFGLVSLIQKALGAVAISVCGAALGLIGYVPDAQNSPETLQALTNLYAFLCGGVLLVSVVIALRYRLSKERHAAVTAAIARKAEGETVDLSEFADII